MKKVVSIFLILTMLCGVFAGCSNAASSATKEKLIVGLDDSFPPMGFRDENNNIVGFDIDLATEVAKRLDMEVEFKPIEWATKTMELDNDRIDLIWNGLSVSPEYEEAMLLSKPYLANAQVVVVMANSTIKTKADLAGKIVGIQMGSTAEQALSKDEISSQIAQVKQYADNVSALLDLKKGITEAVVLDEVVARYYAAKENAKDGVTEEEKYVVLEEALAPEEYAVAFKKGNTALCDKVMGAFDEMVEDGTAGKISEKWFGEDKILK